MEKASYTKWFLRLTERYQVLLVCSFLAVACIAVYWPVGGYEFLHFDDGAYVFENPHVNSGLKAKNITWAFNITNPENKTYWHPLSWISHMVDCQLFGLNAGRHHLMNLLFHTINAVLLFIVLRLATGALWRSAIVASLFAFHPVNMDSVAWVAERKNILSTTFWLLTMYAYVLYTARISLARYLLVVLAFILGLLSKPMLVTLPCVLLLMDYWPLKRIGFPLDREQRERFNENFPLSKGMSPYLWMVLEKVPLFVCALTAVYLSSLSLKLVGNIIPTAQVPMGLRVSNAIVSYPLYLWKFIWPVHLTFFYPYPEFVPGWQVLCSLLLIIVISAWALRYFKRFPYLIVGWLWFLGTLVPVLGIMQGGLWPRYAERWAYVPFIGLFIAATWLLAEAAAGRNHLKQAVVVAVVVLSLFMLKVWMQLPYWKNDFTFFRHAIAVDPGNYVAYTNLGNAYMITGDNDKALSLFSEAVRLNPRLALPHFNIGNILKRAGRYPEAEAQYREALKSAPGDWAYHEMLALVLTSQMKLSDASDEYRTALSLKPDSVASLDGLAQILMTMGEADQAIDLFRKVLEQKPHDFMARTRLGKAYALTDRLDDAIREYSKVLRMKPGFQEALNELTVVTMKRNAIEEKIRTLETELSESPGNLATAYNLAVLNAGKGDYDKALSYLDRMAAAQPDDPDVHYNIACIKAKQNRVDEAVSSLRTAIQKGFSKWAMLKNDRDLANIRGTEFFKNLLQEHP